MKKLLEMNEMHIVLYLKRNNQKISVHLNPYNQRWKISNNYLIMLKVIVILNNNKYIKNLLFLNNKTIIQI